MDEQKYRDLKRGEKGAIISIIAYLILSSLKLLVGSITDSQALRADGLNNATDIMASLAVLIGLRLSQKPPDRDHAYGHWKSEAIASLIASLIMLAVGVQVLLSAVSTLVTGGHESPDRIAGYFGLFAAAVMYGVYRYNKRLANRINSQSLMAAAKDNLSDAWVSIGAAIGIFGSQLHMPWLDVVTAIAVGLLICYTAWGIFRESTHQLTDGFDAEKIRLYRATIQSVPGVKRIRAVKGRTYGNNTVVDVVITVHSSLNINEAHDISTRVEQTLKEKHDIYEVHVHVEPNQ
jgi:cation diffusion facilitator family transporter